MASIWIDELNKHWQAVDLTQGKEFRVAESVLDQHTLASEREPAWRVPYGVDGYAGWQLMLEINRRREHSISLAGLQWPPNADPYSPANDPHHPYYLG